MELTNEKDSIYQLHVYKKSYGNIYTVFKVMTYNEGQFKANVRSPHLKPPNYLYVGERKYNILLTRLRHNCSSLNSDLFNVNIIQYSNCSCGALTENVNHFFFECPLYTQQRNSLLAQLFPNNIVTLDLLLNGNTLLDYDSNKNVILAVLHFIKSTRRFS